MNSLLVQWSQYSRDINTPYIEKNDVDNKGIKDIDFLKYLVVFIALVPGLCSKRLLESFPVYIQYFTI